MNEPIVMAMLATLGVPAGCLWLGMIFHRRAIRARKLRRLGLQ